MDERDVTILMKQLGELDERRRMEILSSVDEQRARVLGALLRYLDPGCPLELRVASIYLLGRHRFSDAAGALLRYIDLDAGQTRSRGPMPLWTRYPALDALITLGRPAFPQVLELLAADRDELRRDLAVKVLRYAEDAEVASLILRRAYEAESDSSRKANLQDALARLEALAREQQKGDRD